MQQVEPAIWTTATTTVQTSSRPRRYHAYHLLMPGFVTNVNGRSDPALVAFLAAVFGAALIYQSVRIFGLLRKRFKNPNSRTER